MGAFDYDVRAGGAVGDGDADDTEAIQAGVDTCAKRGGGRVVLPAGGTYRAATIVLRDDIELHVERGATLLGEGRWSAYSPGPAVSGLSSGVLGGGSGEGRALLSAAHAHGVTLSGGGRIDGGGRHFVAEDLGPIYRMPNERPFPIFFVGCRGVTIRDVELVDAAYWTVRLSRCDDVAITGIRIHNDRKVPNADGIDLDWCSQVRVSGCDIDTGDDAISIKTTEEFDGAGASEDIVVQGCTLRSRSSAVVVGCDLVGPIRRVVVGGCTVRDSHRGFAVNLSQRGTVSDVVMGGSTIETRYDDDAWWGNGEPVYVSTEPWHHDAGTVGRVTFRDLVCRSENGIVVSAGDHGGLGHVELAGIDVEISAWTGLPGGRIDRRPTSGDPFTPAPVSGILAEGADRLTLRDVAVRWSGPTQPWWGDPLAVRDLGALRVDGFTAAAPGPDAPG